MMAEFFGRDGLLSRSWRLYAYGRRRHGQPGRQRHRRRRCAHGAGVGLSIQMQQQDRVALVFFGDGAANEGAFHESLNMAAIWNLPVIYFCENNQYAMSMSIFKASKVENLSERYRAAYHRA